MLIDFIGGALVGPELPEVLELNEAHKGDAPRYFYKINTKIWLYSDIPITPSVVHEWKTENLIT